MSRAYKKPQPEKEVLVDRVCQLAIEQDEEKLTEIIESGEDIHIFDYENNPIILLAKAGEHFAVDFLTVKLKDDSCKLFAVLGYAMGGYVDEVNRLITEASRCWAVEGYAMGGHVNEVNRLIAAGGSRDSAVKGYAINGYVDQVNLQIAAGANRNWAAHYYARGGYVDEVNRQIAAGAEPEYAVLGYRHAGYLADQKALLHIVASTNDADLRKLLVEFAKFEIKSLDTKPLLKKATKLNQLMQESSLTFNQAQGYLKVAANGWLFQGQELVRKGIFPAEMYIHIASFLTGSSNYDTVKIFEAANKRLQDRVVKKNNSGFFSFFRTNKSLNKEVAEGEERYQRRINF